MKARILTRAVVPALLLAVLAAGAAAPGRAASPDPISGEWAAAFEFAGGSPFQRTLKLELDGARVSGTAYSPPRREDGTLSGTWEKGELSLAIESERGTMALTGKLKDGTLAGDWDVGHAKGKWSARKRASASRPR